MLVAPDATISLACQLPQPEDWPEEPQQPPDNQAPAKARQPNRKVMWYLDGAYLHSGGALQDVYNFSLADAATRHLGALSCAHHVLANSDGSFQGASVRVYKSLNEIHLRQRGN